MVKVLIYSSKEIYDSVPYEGRAEANIIAYRYNDYEYRILKNNTTEFLSEFSTLFLLKHAIKKVERQEFERELSKTS